MIAPIRLVRLPTADAVGPQRCAMVSVEPAGGGAWLIRVARGPSFSSLTGGTAYGPVSDGQLAHQLGELLEREVAQGYVQLAAAELVEALQSKSAKVRGRAAVRLGWRREKKAVGALLIAAEDARGDICPIVDALGRIGDPSAIELVRWVADKKNLSRRRSGVEALRNLGDTEGLAVARQANQKRLAPHVAEAIGLADESKVTKASVFAIEQAIAAEDPRKKGAICDALYERDTPLANRVVRRMLTPKTIREPHQWRYAKSILKRSMLRDDAATFAKLAYTIERASLGYSGASAVLKSGLDGQKRSTQVFGKKTQAYIRRACWRYLRDLARYRPEHYVVTAAEVLCHYRPQDATEPQKSLGAFADAFLLQRILYQQSPRLAVNWRSLRTRFTGGPQVIEVPAGVREEAYPALWDRFPGSFLTLLAKSRLPIVQDFGLAGVLRHPEVLQLAPAKTLLDIAELDRPALSDLVRGELERRFGLETEIWPLLSAVLVRGVESLRDASVRWLESFSTVWAADPERLLATLGAADPKVRTSAARLAIPIVAVMSKSTRDVLAQQLLDALARDDAQPGAHAPMVLLAREALVDELEHRFDLDGLLRTIRTGKPALKQVAGFLLGRRPGALAALGIDGLVGLANHELLAVRAAGHAIVRGGAGQLNEDPGVLYALAESDWADTRALAFDLLRTLGLDTLGVEGVVGLCDSTRTEVQILGRELIEHHFRDLQTETILFRLAEHPARHMRSFALGLIQQHLRPGLVPLARIETFLGATLFDLRPRRALKLGLLAFLQKRALMDVGQAEYVATVLCDVLRTHTVIDFQYVSQILALIQTSFPEVKTDLQLREASA